MAQRTQYTHGTFCWSDLSTPDQDGAKTFYTALFGWEVFDAPVGDGAVYSMMLIDGQQVAAISPQPEQQRQMGAPPMWNSYVKVDSADEALARAKELGASVHADAFDVMEAGRMGVIQDPQGAYFEVWEPGQHTGAGLVNAAGALSWNELSTSDIEGASQFYGKLFGWEITPLEGMPMPYSVIKNADDHSNGGIMPLMGEGIPPNWLVYFGTDDLDASVAKSTELGGQTVSGPMDIGMGQIAVIQDPQGAVFALYAGNFDD